MFERQEIAAVLFFVGLGLLVIGLAGVGAWQVSNVIAGFLGGVMIAVGLIWWQILRRR